MSFKPREHDTLAPKGFRRFQGNTPKEMQYAISLVKSDYEHCTSEQLLNIICELRRRGDLNRLGSFLDWLAALNSSEIPKKQPEEYRLV